MIYKDEFGFATSEGMDGMDSAMRTGVLTTFGCKYDDLTMPYKFVNSGIVMRHPVKVPANNPKNCTRDQMIPLAAGLNIAKDSIKAARIYYATRARFCFAQNSERDYPGTTKYPYPHIMSGGDPADNGKWRMFDGPDPMLPHHMLHLALCGKIKSRFFAITGYPCLLLAIVFNSTNVKSEQNQLQCMVKIAGKKWMQLYKRFNKNWKLQTRNYWDSRNESEYADLIIKDFESV